MKTALITIGRLENKYAVEFVEYYQQLGIDHIYIIDNNYDGEEYFEDVLQSYVDEDFVTILNYRNKEYIQIKAYKDVYDEYGKLYDYMMFFDFDEFLTLKNHKTIKEYLSDNKENFDVICINWRLYNDNDLIYYENKPCIERFTQQVDINNDLNNIVKSIVKTNIENLNWYYAHVPYSNYEIFTLNYCDNNFNKIEFENILSMRHKYDDTLAYIKHFIYKTIDEFGYKLTKGGSHSNNEEINEFRINNFFNINKKTIKKETILNNYIK